MVRAPEEEPAALSAKLGRSTAELAREDKPGAFEGAAGFLEVDMAMPEGN